MLNSKSQSITLRVIKEDNSINLKVGDKIELMSEQWEVTEVKQKGLRVLVLITSLLDGETTQNTFWADDTVKILG